MPKGQLSRIPWPGMLFTSQAALWALQQHHKHSCSLQLAIRTQLTYHYI